MPYYPQSFIKPNLYTGGGEYVLVTTRESYTGPYYELANGKKYTGGTPQDGPNILLIPAPLIYATEESFPGNVDTSYDTYINYTTSNTDFNTDPEPNRVIGGRIDQYVDKNRLLQRKVPRYSPTIPNNDDINLGIYQRFFCKKTNELRYLEIDKETYDALFNQDKSVAYDLYIPKQIMWYIKGNEETIYKANKGLVSLVESKDKWYGFSQYFKEDFLQYYVGV